MSLVHLARLTELGEEVRTPTTDEPLKSLVEVADKPTGAVETVLASPAAEIVLPCLTRRRPLVATMVQPALVPGMVKTFEAPVGGRRVETLPVPLDHDDLTARGQIVGDLVQHLPWIGDVMEGRARHDSIQRTGDLALLELDTPVVIALWRRRIDSNGLVASLEQPRYEATEPPAPHLHDPRGR